MGVCEAAPPPLLPPLVTAEERAASPNTSSPASPRTGLTALRVQSRACPGPWRQERQLWSTPTGTVNAYCGPRPVEPLLSRHLRGGVIPGNLEDSSQRPPGAGKACHRDSRPLARASEGPPSTLQNDRAPLCPSECRGPAGAPRSSTRHSKARLPPPNDVGEQERCMNQNTKSTFCQAGA